MPKALANNITPEHIIAAEIMKTFVLKCTPLDKDVIKTFAKAALEDGFLPFEIQQACFEVARDADLRKITYADIYERAKKSKAERIREEKHAGERREQALQEAERQRWLRLSAEEKEAELKKLGFRN